jgi:catechol 2,3-dioxygenase-like lactoylglutathione lyase family enzyme
MKNKTILRFVPILAVKDLTRSIAFYRLLGFSARRYRDGDDYAFLTRDGHELHLTQSDMLAEGQHVGNGIYFYLTQGTAAALEAEFRTAGATILSSLSPREWRMNEFVLADPDANLLRFGEEIASSDTGKTA